MNHDKSKIQSGMEKNNMDKKLTFRVEGLEITGSKERLEELISCISFEENEPSNPLADIVSEIETVLDLK